MDRSECLAPYPGCSGSLRIADGHRPLKVLKFGGTSVGLADRLLRLVEIVQAAAATHRVVVVASAASGVTDRLVEAWEALSGEAGHGEAEAVLAALRDRYGGLAEQVLTLPGAVHYATGLADGLCDVSTLLTRIVREGRQPAPRAALLAAGERLCVPLVAQALAEAGLAAVPADATALIRTDATYDEAVVDLAQTYRQVRYWHHRLAAGQVPVVPGFIGATAAGETTVLGRGGSDYTAALLASALQAEVLERWTDTDGLYTADPRKNRRAKRLAYIRMDEALAWNHAGRLGMHRKALDPLREAGVAVHVRATATPDKPGTLILPDGQEAPRSAVAF